MKHLLLLTLLIGSLTAYCQDSIPQWPIVEYRDGFKITDYPFLCVKYNAKEKVSHIYCMYPHKMLVSVNGNTAVKMGKRNVIDVKAEHFTVTVTRKRYRRIYQF